jgi:RNA polymerase sigma-70 factor (ECF subfamily)
MATFPLTRASLLVRLRDPQDNAAWLDFVDLYAPLVYGYARKQGLQEADAADLCQEVLGAVAGSVNQLDYDPARGAFRNWLFTIVRRKLSNWRRKMRHSPAENSGHSANQLLEQHPEPEASETAWDAEWEQRLFAWACAEVQRTVNPTTWQAFWMTAVDAQPGKQVAANLGMTVAAVYLARSRVFARLRELVQSVQEP